MGANASKIDDALGGLGDDPSSPRSRTRPSPFDSYSRRVAVDTRDASSNLRPFGMVLPSSATDSSRGCRLPPVESYDTVKAQVDQVTRWSLVDSSDDLWASTTYQERSATISPSPRLEADKISPLNPSIKANDASRLNDNQSSKRCRSPPVLQPRKKRRLILTPRAAEIATQQPELEDESPSRVDWHPLQQTNGMVCDFEDEGYTSFTVTPTDVSGTADAPCSDEQREGDLVKSLANLQQSALESPPPEPTAEEESHGEDSLQAAENLKAQEEQAGAERSRLLRERALMRQRSEALSTEILKTPDAKFHQPSTEVKDRTYNPPDTHQSDLFSDIEETSLDELFSIAMDHRSQQARLDPDHFEPSRVDIRDAGHPKYRLNPTSRAAAEEFRTQDRHLSHHNNGLRKPRVPHPSLLHDRENRLRELKTSQHINSHVQNTQTSMDDHSLTSSPSPLHHEIDSTLDSRPSSHRDTKERGSNRLSGLEMLAAKNGRDNFWAVADHRGASKAPINSQTQFGDELYTTTPEPEPKGTESRYRSSFERQRLPDSSPSLSHRQDTDMDKEGAIQPRNSSGPAQIESTLALPKNFHTLPEETKLVVVQHETLKERRRDLEIIDRVTTSIARLRCVAPFTYQDEKDVSEVRRFMKLVLHDNKYGKLARKRIQDIRCNIDQRAIRHSSKPPTKDEIEKYHRDLFNEDDITILEKSIPQVEEQVAKLGTTRNTMTNDRHRHHRRKKVTFALPPKDSRSASRRPKAHRQNNGSASENRRNSQYASQDRQMDVLREKLRQFDASLSEDPDQSSQRELSASPENGSDDESTISEDTTGAEYYLPASQGNTMEGDHETQLSDAWRRDALSAPLCGNQRIDLELLKQIREKQIEVTSQSRSETDLAEAQESDTAIISSSDEAEEEDEDEDEDGGPKQLFKYTVWGNFYGVKNYKDNDDYRFLGTYKQEAANQKISECVLEFQHFYVKAGIGADRWSLEIEFDHGLMEQRLHLGLDSDVEARFFVTKKVVDLGRKAYRRAKDQNIAVRETVYMVEWEHTSTPLQEAVDSEQFGERQEEDEDELFGPDISEPPAPLEPTTTVIPSSQLVHYNDVASANRQAMHIYLDWHFKFLPGLENEYWRRLEYENAEDQLKRLGDWGLWSRGETLEAVQVIEEGGDGQAEDDLQEEQEGQDEQGQGKIPGQGGDQLEEDEDEVHGRGDGDGDGGNGGNLAGSVNDNVPWRTQRVREHFKVWVRKAQVFGPGN